MTTTHATRTPWLLHDGGHGDLRSIPAGVEYHRMLAGDERRIARGILAIFLLVAGLAAFSLATNSLAEFIDDRLGNDPRGYSPVRHAATLTGPALLIPWSMLLQKWLYGVPGASLHSVLSRFRFDLFGKTLLVFGPAWLLVTQGNFAPTEEAPWAQADLIAMLLVSLLLTPLQSAGEEYGIRGLAFRIIGSWTRSPRAGLIAGVAATSILFTAMHGSTDPYINAWYLVLWTCLALITWRTGGLEVAIVLHAVLNTFTFVAAFYLRVDFGSAIADRSAGVGTPVLLVPAVAVALITAIIWRMTRRVGPARTPAAAGAPPR